MPCLCCCCLNNHTFTMSLRLSGRVRGSRARAQAAAPSWPPAELPGLVMLSPFPGRALREKGLWADPPVSPPLAPPLMPQALALPLALQSLGNVCFMAFLSIAPALQNRCRLSPCIINSPPLSNSIESTFSPLPVVLKLYTQLTSKYQFRNLAR